MKELISRFKAPTPLLFKRIRVAMISMAGAFGAFGVTVKSMEDLPGWVYKIGTDSMVLSVILPLIAALLVSFTVDNKDELKQ